MSIFKTLLTKIWDAATVLREPSQQATHETSIQAPAPTTPAAQPKEKASAPNASTAPEMVVEKAGSPQQTPQPVDVEATLDAMRKMHPEKLNWKTSVVDLLKLAGMDSSLSARKELAQELEYTGSTDDTAAMNMWLHAEVMQKISENGGKLPQELLQHAHKN